MAYLDILGITDRIKSNKAAQTESLNVLHNFYTHIIELSGSESGINKYADIKFEIFSDNIIIAKELSEHSQVDDIAVLLNCVSNFLCFAVGDSVCWLVRGGVTVGYFYIDDMIVWGPALLRTYEIESKTANYPRVILDYSVTNLLNSTNVDPEFILQDEDGMNYLNYMHIWHFSGLRVKNAFEHMKSEACRTDGTYPEKVLQKLCWHMKYINHELNRKDEIKDRKYRLSI